jgi:hypothetical protein
VDAAGWAMGGWRCHGSGASDDVKAMGGRRSHGDGTDHHATAMEQE